MLRYINLNFIREVSFNHLFQIGGKSLRRRVKAIVSNVFYALTGMNIRRSLLAAKSYRIKQISFPNQCQIFPHRSEVNFSITSFCRKAYCLL